LQTFKLDPNKFPKILRNIIITYVFLALVGLGMVWLYLRENLFTRAWGLIPFVLIIFALVGWFAIRERKRYWEDFRLEIDGDAIERIAYKTGTLMIKKSEIMGLKEVRQGLIIAVRGKENALLIPRQLTDRDYQLVKRKLENWANHKK
jgi:hypothetical protein